MHIIYILVSSLYDAILYFPVFSCNFDCFVRKNNLYEEEYFIGREQWAYDDTPSFDYDYEFAR